MPIACVGILPLKNLKIVADGSLNILSYRYAVDSLVIINGGGSSGSGGCSGMMRIIIVMIQLLLAFI